MPNPWDRQRDDNGELEPGRWYHRFTMFRALGHDRSMLRVCNQWRRDKARNVGTSTPLSWGHAATLILFLYFLVTHFVQGQKLNG